MLTLFLLPTFLFFFPLVLILSFSSFPPINHQKQHGFYNTTGSLKTLSIFKRSISNFVILCFLYVNNSSKLCPLINTGIKS